MKCLINANPSKQAKSTFTCVLLSLIMSFCFFIPEVSAQSETQASLTEKDSYVKNETNEMLEPPLDAVPPPLKRISTEEKRILENESKLKKRTQLSLSMMESRLLQAEQFTSQDNYKKSLEDLAGFQALLENTMFYLETNDVNNKADGRFKQLEMFLRKQVPRLENLRRAMPYKYGYYVLRLMKVVRDSRAKAVEPLFANTVVPQS